MASAKHADANRPVSGAVLALRRDLSTKMRPLASFAMGERSVDIMAGSDAIWAIVRRSGKGGVALRIAHCPGDHAKVKLGRARKGEALRMKVTCNLGVYTVVLRCETLDLALLRATVELTPAIELLIPFHPRDLYPLDNNDDPIPTEGRVEAAQRGVNSGLCYLHIDQPAFGSILYFQNLTRLNHYFQATHTKPDAAVGGQWPELGYLPPTPAQSGTPPTHPLAANIPVTMSDAILVFHDGAAGDEQQSARLFLQLLGNAYRQLDLPQIDFRDWVSRAQQTLHDLETSPKATIRHYGHTYIHPYTDAEYPDIMVQMSLVAALRDYAAWIEAPVPFGQELEGGLSKFHDTKLGTMRRYLPNVGKDKDKLAVDSWYLYHPLLNLGRVALEGDARARGLFMGTLDFAIKVARHFDYAWPIQFKVDDFAVIVKAQR